MTPWSCGGSNDSYPISIIRGKGIEGTCKVCPMAFKVVDSLLQASLGQAPFIVKTVECIEQREQHEVGYNTCKERHSYAQRAVFKTRLLAIPLAKVSEYDCLT